MWTSLLVRRVTPVAAIAAILAIQAAAGAGPVLVFPLYLTVILLTALQVSRSGSLATAALAAIALLMPPLVRGDQAENIAPAVLLAIVLMVTAVAITEVVRQVRESTAEA